jgi:hypothetical protein
MVEQGMRGMTVPRYIKICNTFRVSLDYLLTGQEHEPARNNTALSGVLLALNDYQRLLLTNFARNLSLYNYSKTDIDLIFDAIDYQVSMFHKIRESIFSK